MNTTSGTSTRANEIEDAYPLSLMQQGMLFHSLCGAGTGVYVEQVLCELQEAVDEAALRRAWAAVIGRHPVLRTDFRWVGIVGPQQVVHAKVSLPWEQQDWRGIADAEQKRRVADSLEKDRRRGFDMACAPLLRLALLRCCDKKNLLIWTFHHALLDGRSFVHVLREVFAHYDALRAGAEFRPDARRPYRDYISWLRKQDFSQAEGFWKRALEGFIAPTLLRIHDEPSKVQKSKGGHGVHEIRLSSETTSTLQSFARENGLTLNTIMMGAWSLLLSRYSNEADVVFGATRACRRSTIDGAGAMIGMFINSLPVRVRVSPEAALIPWLKELREQWVRMREHEHTPLEKVQGWSDLPAGSSLFETILVFENADLNTLLRMQGGSWLNRQFRLFEQVNYPIVLAVYGGSELQLKIGYDRSRFGDDTAGRMVVHLRTLLEAMIAAPCQRLCDLPLLSPAERSQALVDWNQTEKHYPKNICVQYLFEAQVEKTPNAIAVTFDERHLTYRDLNNRANHLAHYLRELGVGPEVLVGLCADRSLELIVGLFGILKAGGAYVPIDPDYPAGRTASILKEANPPVVLTQQSLTQTLPLLEGARIVCLDCPAWGASVQNIANLDHTATDENLAYLIYTSGSTTKPKGVMISHRAIMNVMLWMQSAFPLNERDRVLQNISISFDPSLLEILAPLIAGGRLVLAQPGGHRDPAYLVRTIVQHGITVLHAVPSMLGALLETTELHACSSLRHVFTGGEGLTQDVVRRFFEVAKAELHYLYGPTEVAITSVYFTIPRDYRNEIIPIGRPLPNTQAYVLDGHGQLAPLGVTGELYLGGVQVGRGYYKQPELTRDRFIPDPFKKGTGAQLFKTGDLVRRLPDGNLQFLGRKDRQVKIRGYRIELGEIESIMSRHPAVKEAVVAVREITPADKRLVAYIRPALSSPTLVSEIRTMLAKQLPSYMIPSAFVFLDAFPVLPNGKLDNKGLVQLNPESFESDELDLYLPPRTPTEKILASIWCEVLNVEKVGVHDNFFDLGGHSLLIIRLGNRITQAFSVNISVPELFSDATVAKLAKVIKGYQERNVVQLRQGKAEPPVYFIYAGPDELRLSQAMGERHPVFGIQVTWPAAWRDALEKNKTSAFPSMEQLVAPYVAALSSHNKSSSCVLAGHSFGGLMAFEAAHQFQLQGGNVDAVILFDTWAKFPRLREVAWHKWQHEWSQSHKGAINKATFIMNWKLINSWHFIRKEAMKKFTALLSALNRRKRSSALDEQLHFDELADRLYKNAYKFYRLRHLNTQGILFFAEPPSQEYRRSLDESLGWNSLFTGGLEIVRVAGDHMFRQSHQELAQKMNDVLKRFSAGEG
ncbi:MAG TPA: amino acid adenylation domain-containing protein [Pyrinomonadaceae bacterium]|nr:amino acid adenylation domain-containing protein [Pyrinomonadaceae bacterium]